MPRATRDGDGTVEHPRVDDDRAVGSAVNPDGDLVGCDGDGSGQVEVTEAPVGVCVGVATHLARQEPEQITGDHEQRMSKSTLIPTVELSAFMWKKRAASDRAFSISIRRAHRVTTLAALVLRLAVAGQQDGGLLVAEILDHQPPELAADDLHLGVVHQRGARVAGGHIELDLAPRRGRSRVR